MTGPMHTVELELPLDVADELAAKAGTVDAAVVQALQDYMQTDPAHRATRDNTIRRLAAKGKPHEQIAAIYGLTLNAVKTITQ
jgi:DNA-binding NarL/FixJ family response regulator